MSDHGEVLGDHGIYLKGPYFYDCLTRVPLMICWLGHYKEGTKVDALVELIDLARTLLEAAGVPVPSANQGRSLNSLLTGDTKEDRELVYTGFLDANASYAIPPMLTQRKDNQIQAQPVRQAAQRRTLRLGKGSRRV
jgi:arylsulfatase